MKLQDYLKKVLDEAEKQITARIEFDLILDDKCEVNKNGCQRVHFEVMQIK